jgi:hypothetical protein
LYFPISAMSYLLGEKLLAPHAIVKGGKFDRSGWFILNLLINASLQLADEFK